MSAPRAAHEVRIAAERDIVQVRQVVRELALSAGFSLVAQTKTVTAASELARNTLMYGGGGTATATLDEAPGGPARLRITFRDAGPGISDVDLALQDGYSTGGGLGLGLSGARRLADEFGIETGPGAGTAVTVVFIAREAVRR
ncbi:ATP-binding protein [Saccharopolyspora spinosa]|uniref:Serine/threonine-protein kinase RsbT n=1 Tax=Saccharopolyspora spinosa TaxID=60894 RepID=A0A2N3Y5L8_SACSN|nr:ATP-binding protein [Saccharopolyspora spinosa]PKW18183.1 serine/threonine-protein kinase RsbT [Saccharopolyspora spinosa]